MRSWTVCFYVCLLLFTDVFGFCPYGTNSDCVLKCHCANTVDCARTDRTCPSGCATAPLGYNWRGPACQIGNVAYQKTVRAQLPFTVDTTLNSAVDGFVNTCVHVHKTDQTMASLVIDLTDRYIVESITIILKALCCELDKMNTFIKVSVVDENVFPPKRVLCGYHNNTASPPISLQVTCPQTTVGQQVEISRMPDGAYLNQEVICEAIVEGYKYIDCSKCTSDVACNKVTGCDTCLGTYQPTCDTVCADGFYGVNCVERCGRCLNNDKCFPTDGNCPNGCEKWYAPEKCQVVIDKPIINKNTSRLLRTLPEALELGWTQAENIADVVANHVGYEIRKSNIDDAGEVVKTVFHTAGSTQNQAIVEGLKGSTAYTFTIVPFRRWVDNSREYVAPYDQVKGFTNCGSPASPVLKSVTRIPVVDDRSEKVDVIFQNLLSVAPHCVRLTKAWIEYHRVQDRAKTTTVELNLRDIFYSFVPQNGGTYNIWMKVQNNEGLNATSNILSVTVDGPPSTANKVQLEILIPCIIGGVIIIILIAILVVCCKRKRLPKDAPYEAHIDEEEDITDEIEVVAFTGQVIKDIPKRAKKSKRATQGLTGGSHNIYENYELPAVTSMHVDDFLHYVDRRIGTDNFAGEFRSLQKPNLARCVCAKLPNNILKNRYKNIYPYDDTRVIIRPDDPIRGDFINASYITGFHGNVEYIATQGPCDTTMLDFWTMIWEEQANRIVMVANRSEYGKIRCSQYWSQKIGSSIVLGPFTIKTERQDTSADYTIRTLTIIREDKQLKVHHFHFSTWDDKIQPHYGTTPVLAFFRRVHAFDQYSQGPMVVHCSAGVGRTGTFIALDILQYQSAKEGRVDVYRCVRRLREERMLMVHTEGQYVFIHDALTEFITCGDTSYPTESFDIMYLRLKDPDPNLDNASRLQLQYQLFSEMKKEEQNIESRDGLREPNVNKNRDLQIIPDDFSRPHLRGKSGSEYINAVFVDSYRLHDQFIVTQMPLPDTVRDFWRMVVSVGSHTIIMLNQFDNKDPTSKPYWPSKDNPKVTYGSIKVELLDEGSKVASIYTKDFLVQDTHDKNALGFKVRHFQLLTWCNKSDTPANASDLLLLLEAARSWHYHIRATHAPGNVIIHCLNGCHHSGLFCAVSHVLDRMRVEREVDGFTAARYVTRRRPQFLHSQEQYNFLFEIARIALEKEKCHNEQ